MEDFYQGSKRRVLKARKKFFKANKSLGKEIRK